MRKIKRYIKNNNIVTVILLIVVFVGGYFLLSSSPQETIRPSYRANDSIVRVADDDPVNALYINNNPKFSVLLGDKESPNKPTVTYISHTSNTPHSLSFTLADSSANAPAPSLETVVSGGDKKPRLIYRSALDNADINYRIDKGKGVKEEIILKVAPADNGGRDVGFVFDTELSAGVQVEQGKDGVWYFTDSGGNYLFNFERPFMVDADGVRSNDVAIDIVPTSKSIFKEERSDGEKFDLSGKRSVLAEQDTQTYQIILKANGPWLFDEARAYPVMIDPSVTHNADSDFTGRFNRVVDADTTSSTQLEIGYQEHGLDPYTVLLLHGNEATGSTVITDMASSTRVITANGNASTTSAVTQLGLGNSLAFDGTGDYFSIPDSDDWDAVGSANNYTIDLWVKHDDHVGSEDYVSQDEDGQNFWFFYHSHGTGLRFAVYSNDAYIVDTVGGGEITDTNWHHVAMVKEGNNYTVYKDGNSVTSITDASTDTFTGPLKVAAGNGSVYLDGNIDELRITKGRALTIEEIKAAASRRPYAVYTSQVIDATVNSTWDTLSWTEGGVNTGDGETLYDDTSLVAQWNFNETSGTSASDSSANSHTGTLTNFASTASQDQAAGTGWTAENKRWGAGALMFDGTNDYVSVPDSDDWSFGSGDFTLEAWVNPDEVGDTLPIIIHRPSPYNVGGYQFQLGGAPPGDFLTVNFVNSSDVTIGAYVSTAHIKAGEWTHLIFVRSGSANKIYVNGIEGTTENTALGATTLENMADSLLIGRNNTAYFDGTIDSLRIYKGRALSQAEILSNYNVGNIEIQTRSGATSDPNDGTWEAWKPVTSETQVVSMDTDRTNWLPYFSATGGTITYADGYAIHTFTSDGTFTPNSAGTVEYLVVAGGGGGAVGSNWGGGGGGGAGGYKTDTGQAVDAQAYSITVGGGGAGSASGSGTSGSDSSFDSLVTSTGGGGAGSDSANGKSGGSGGGGGGSSATGGAGTAGEGNDGGDGSSNAGGAGGGAGAVGANASGTSGGAGGAGTASTITGSSVTYAGGGGGAAHTGGSGGAGGSGGGGGGGDPLAVGTNGTANTGGGGGGGGGGDAAGRKGGDGGSGIVIIRYPTAYVQLSDESNIKMEGTGSLKIEIGKASTTASTVALWHFEETGTTTGTTLFDATANNNDATTTSNPAVVDGIFGKARKFDGVDDYITVPDSADWDWSGDFSVDFWIKFDSTSGTQAMIGTEESGVWFRVYYNGAGLLYMTNSASMEITRSWTPSTNVWYHIAWTRSGSNNKMIINGVQQGATVTNSTSYAPTSVLSIGRSAVYGQYFKGIMDELRIIHGSTLSDDEVAENYRLGANHKISRDITAQDFSASTTMPFWVAADELGTYLEATIGESAFANFDSATTSTSTVLFLHGDEIASSTSIKDSSISSHTVTANGHAKITGAGKIGNAMTFDGTTDYFTVGDTSDFKFLHGAEDTTGFKWTIEGWYKSLDFSAHQMIFSSYAGGSAEQGLYVAINSTKQIWMAITRGVGSSYVVNGGFPVYFPNDNEWHHLAITYDQSLVSANAELFIDGKSAGTIDKTGNAPSTANSNEVLTIGALAGAGSTEFTGDIDEVRIHKDTIMTQAEIRNAYEYGARTHPITIDFKASLQPSDLIADSGDTQFAITATTTGLSATTTGLYIGDKIIVKENVNGTEYLAQGTATTTNTTTGVVNVDQWDTGSTFPAGGYTPHATVFKWQREYMPLGGIFDSHIDAVERITLRPTNGAGGRTVYLDDFRGSSGFLTASSSEAITSGENRYFQYRTIYTTADTAVSPYLTDITINHTLIANSSPSVIGTSGGGFLTF